MNDEKPIRIIIADDHTLFRQGMIKLLSENKNLFIVGEAANGEELIDAYIKYKPDVVIVDFSMPKLSGTEAALQIKKIDSSAKILFLSMYSGEEYIYHCLKVGGLGLINKNSLKGELLYAINQVNDNKKYFGSGWNDNQVDELVRKLEHVKSIEISGESMHFTATEDKIIRFISEGLTSTEIADKLNVSKRTIDTHRSHIMQKLNLKSLPELLKYALQFSISNKGTSNH